MPPTDTKATRTAIIVVAFVTLAAAASTFVDHGRDLADRKTDQLEEAVSILAGSTTYEEAVDFDVDRFVLDGVRPGVVDDAIPGELVVEWDVQKWGVHRCISARWEQGAAAVVTRKDC